MDTIIKLLEKIDAAPVVNIGRNGDNLVVFDFARNNEELADIDTSNPAEFGKYITDLISGSNAKVGIGRYDENRVIYATKLFSGEIRRTVHLGIDIFMDAGTPISAPLDGMVHSFQNNNSSGDYGPTIILEHSVEGNRFYTLYGHLSPESLENLTEGQTIRKGDVFCSIGHHSINGGWPEHLHFQIITDLSGMKGDFPGVCSMQDRKKYLTICPNPNLLLRLEISCPKMR